MVVEGSYHCVLSLRPITASATSAGVGWKWLLSLRQRRRRESGVGSGRVVVRESSQRYGKKTHGVSVRSCWKIRFRKDRTEDHVLRCRCVEKRKKCSSCERALTLILSCAWAGVIESAVGDHELNCIDDHDERLKWYIFRVVYSRVFPQAPATAFPYRKFLASFRCI